MKPDDTDQWGNLHACLKDILLEAITLASSNNVRNLVIFNQNVSVHIKQISTTGFIHWAPIVSAALIKCKEIFNEVKKIGSHT